MKATLLMTMSVRTSWETKGDESKDNINNNSIKSTFNSCSFVGICWAHG